MSVSDYANLHAEALASNDFANRARATWGLIAQGDQGVSWAREHLTPAHEDLMLDALSVLGWLGVPPDLIPYLTGLLDRLPDSELRSAIHGVLPESAIAAHEAPEEAVAPAGDEVPLNGGMDPFTEVIYFVHTPYQKFLPAFRDAWGRHGKAQEHRGSLADLLSLLEPYGHPHYKTLAVECRNDWTALFDQGADLTYADRFPAALKTVGVRTAYSPHVRQGGRVVRYGDVAFWMTDGSRKELGPLFGLRSIQVSYQSGWDWFVSGEVQSWEETDRYERKRIRERFDLSMMNRYCRALGIRRAEADFYGPRGTLMAQDTRGWRNKPKGIPSAEWRQQHRPG